MARMTFLPLLDSLSITPQTSQCASKKKKNPITTIPPKDLFLPWLGNLTWLGKIGENDSKGTHKVSPYLLAAQPVFLLLLPISLPPSPSSFCFSFPVHRVLWGPALCLDIAAASALSQNTPAMVTRNLTFSWGKHKYDYIHACGNTW